MSKVIVVNNSGALYLLNRDPVQPGTNLYNSVVNNKIEIPAGQLFGAIGNAWRASDPVEFDLDQLVEGTHYYTTTLEELMQNADIRTPSSVWSVYEGLTPEEHDLNQPLLVSPRDGFIRFLDASARKYYLGNAGVIVPEARVSDYVAKLPPAMLEQLRKDGVVVVENNGIPLLNTQDGIFGDFHNPERMLLVGSIGVHRVVKQHPGGSVTVVVSPVFDFEELIHLFIRESRGAADYTRDRSLVAMHLVNQVDPNSPVRLISVQQYSMDIDKLMYPQPGPDYPIPRGVMQQPIAATFFQPQPGRDGWNNIDPKLQLF